MQNTEYRIGLHSKGITTRPGLFQRTLEVGDMQLSLPRVIGPGFPNHMDRISK